MAAPDPVSIIARADRMKADRSTAESVWEEIRDLVFPLGESFLTRETPGTKSHQKVFDNTGEMAAEALAAGLMGLMYSGAWFRLRAADEKLNDLRDNAIWLEDASRRMRIQFARPDSGFDTHQHVKLMDLGGYGTGGMFLGDRPGFGPWFQARPLNELLLDQNDEGRVDVVIRDYEISARKAVQAYGDAVGEKVLKAAGDVKTEGRTFRFLQLIGPRRDRAMGRLDGPNRPWTDIVVDVEDRHVCHNGGYYEFPMVVPRWFARPCEVYGRGRGHVALGDVKELQAVMKDTIGGLALMVRPPLLVPDDGMMSPTRMRAGGLTTVRWDLLMRGAHPKPMLNGARPDLGEEFMQAQRLRIDNAFFKTIMQRFRDPRMTATQVLKEEEETLRFLRGILGRLQQEDAGPMIARVFAVMFRRGMFLPLPPALADARLDVEYVSPVSRSEQLAEVRGVATTMEVLAPFVPHYPEILDNFEGDEIARHVAKLAGMPAGGLRDVRRRDAIRQARNEARQAEESRVAINEAAAAGGQAAPLLQVLQGKNGGGRPPAEAA